MIKILKQINKNFNKGVTIFQMCLMISMIAGAIIGSRFLVLFCLFNCLVGYLNDKDYRFGFEKEKEK